MRRIAGTLIGFAVCGLLPAVLLSIALNSRETQLRLNLPGADHGFGNLFVAVWVLLLGGALGGYFGARWGVRSGTQEDQDAEHRPQRGDQERE